MKNQATLASLAGWRSFARVESDLQVTTEGQLAFQVSMPS